MAREVQEGRSNRGIEGGSPLKSVRARKDFQSHFQGGLKDFQDQNYNIYNILDDIYSLQAKVKELNPENTISFIKLIFIPKIVQFKQDSHFSNMYRGLEILIFNDFLEHLSHREAPTLSDSGIISSGEQVIHNYGAWREKGYMGVHLKDQVRVQKL